MIQQPRGHLLRDLVGSLMADTGQGGEVTFSEFRCRPARPNHTQDPDFG